MYLVIPKANTMKVILLPALAMVLAIAHANRIQGQIKPMKRSASIHVCSNPVFPTSQEVIIVPSSQKPSDADPVLWILSGYKAMAYSRVTPSYWCYDYDHLLPSKKKKYNQRSLPENDMNLIKATSTRICRRRCLLDLRSHHQCRVRSIAVALAEREPFLRGRIHFLSFITLVLDF